MRSRTLTFLLQKENDVYFDWDLPIPKSGLVRLTTNYKGHVTQNLFKPSGKEIKSLWKAVHVVTKLTRKMENLQWWFDHNEWKRYSKNEKDCIPRLVWEKKR